MTRAGVLWLVLCCALLVLDGGATVPETRVPVAAGPTADEPWVPSQAQIAARLGEINPQLSPGQRERIAAAVVRYSDKYGLDRALVVGVIEAESTARPWARSSKGAEGLMQVMPHMKGSLEIAGNLTTIESNIEAGCLILADNIRRLGESRGILAYFWGNDIRGVSYLRRVERARAAIRRPAES